jgi:hypothetical protein
VEQAEADAEAAAEAEQIGMVAEAMADMASQPLDLDGGGGDLDGGDPDLDGGGMEEGNEEYDEVEEVGEVAEVAEVVEVAEEEEVVEVAAAAEVVAVAEAVVAAEAEAEKAAAQQRYAAKRNERKRQKRAAANAAAAAAASSAENIEAVVAAVLMEVVAEVVAAAEADEAQAALGGGFGDENEIASVLGDGDEDEDEDEAGGLLGLGESDDDDEEVLDVMDARFEGEQDGFGDDDDEASGTELHADSIRSHEHRSGSASLAPREHEHDASRVHALALSSPHLLADNDAAAAALVADGAARNPTRASEAEAGRVAALAALEQRGSGARSPSASSDATDGLPAPFNGGWQRPGARHRSGGGGGSGGFVGGSGTRASAAEPATEIAALRDPLAALSLAQSAYNHLARALEQRPESSLYILCAAQLLVLMGRLSEMTSGGSGVLAEVRDADRTSPALAPPPSLSSPRGGPRRCSNLTIPARLF